MSIGVFILSLLIIYYSANKCYKGIDVVVSVNFYDLPARMRSCAFDSLRRTTDLPISDRLDFGVEMGSFPLE